MSTTSLERCSWVWSSIMSNEVFLRAASFWRGKRLGQSDLEDFKGTSARPKFRAEVGFLSKKKVSEIRRDKSPLHTKLLLN